MKVGFAVQVDEGAESRVFDHFGSAPAFIIVDQEGKDFISINNKDLNHVHGACNPIMALNGQTMDAMVVGGIGAGALRKLNALGIKVFGAAAPTVKENLALLKDNKLQELTENHSCRGHQGGCGH
jgi:predicted Fe-Mo cluster-binding NifX family protein